MDAEDEERLRTEIILIELRKLSKLLEKHRGQLTGSALTERGLNGMETGEIDHEGRVHESVFALLEARVRAVGRGLRDGSRDAL